MPYNYIEALDFENDEIAYRIDITGKTEEEIQIIQADLDSKINFEFYYTRIIPYELEQPIISILW